MPDSGIEGCATPEVVVLPVEKADGPKETNVPLPIWYCHCAVVGPVDECRIVYPNIDERESPYPVAGDREK